MNQLHLTHSPLLQALLPMEALLLGKWGKVISSSANGISKEVKIASLLVGETTVPSV